MALSSCSTAWLALSRSRKRTGATPTKQVCLPCASSTSSIAPERHSKKAVRAQIPMGAEGDFEGVVDLLSMKAYTFTGNMGEDVIEGEVPEQFIEEAKKYRAELLERIVEHDEAQMNAFFEGNEPS